MFEHPVSLGAFPDFPLPRLGVEGVILRYSITAKISDPENRQGGTLSSSLSIKIRKHTSSPCLYNRTRLVELYSDVPRHPRVHWGRAVRLLVSVKIATLLCSVRDVRRRGEETFIWLRNTILILASPTIA